MYRIYRKISDSFQGDFEFLLKSGSFWKIFVRFYSSFPGVSLMMREVSHVCYSVYFINSVIFDNLPVFNVRCNEVGILFSSNLMFLA